MSNFASRVIHRIDEKFPSTRPYNVLVWSVLALALPAVGEQVVNLAVNLVDVYLAGHLDAASVTAMGISQQWTQLVMVLFVILNAGSVALVARSVGAGDLEFSNHILSQALLYGFIIGAISAILVWDLDFLLVKLLQTPKESVMASRKYLRVISIGFPLWGAMLVGNSVMRGAGDTKTPFVIMTILNVVTIVAEVLFVFGFGIVPKTGVVGIAIGSVIGLLVGFVITIGILISGKAKLRLRRIELLPDLSLLSRVLKVGWPAGIETGLMIGAFLVLTGVIASLGSKAYAAYKIVSVTGSITGLIGTGFGIGAASLVGQALGASKPKRARRSAYLSAVLAAIVMSLVGLLFILFPSYIIGIFTHDATVIRLGRLPLQLLGIIQPLYASQIVFSRSLRGAGDTSSPMVITSTSIWVIRLGGAYLLGHILGLGLLGVWIAIVSDFGVRGIAYLFWFRVGKWVSIRV